MADIDELPTVKRHGKADRIHVRAQQIWLILVAWVMERQREAGPHAEPITYGDVAARMGLDRRAGRTLVRPLGLVGQLCLANQLPALNAIVVNEHSGRPEHGIVLAEDRTPREEQRLVFEFNWYSVRMPTPGMFRALWETHWGS